MLVKDYLAKNPKSSDREVGEAVGLSGTTVNNIRKRLGIASNPAGHQPSGTPGLGAQNPKAVKPGEREIVEDAAGDQKRVTVKSCDLRTPEQVLAFAKIDTKVWRVVKVVTTSWEVTMRTGAVATSDGETTTTKHDVNTYTNFQIKLWLERTIPAATQDAMDHIIAEMKSYAPKYPTIARPRLKDEKFLYEIAAMADPQIGRLSWGKETGVDFDVKIATTILVNAVHDLLARVKDVPVEKILLPFTGDSFEMNDTTNETPTNHNRLNVDGRYINVFECGVKCVKQMVEACLTVAPVHILWVPGNHDPQSGYHLVRTIEAWFNRCKDVTVDRSPKPRKAFRYGDVFLGFTHGCGLKTKDVGAVFMSEFRHLIADAKHIEVHMGHTHKMNEVRTAFGNTETGGIRTRILTSMSGPSNWEYEAGFHNFQCAEAYKWSSKYGYVGHESVYAKMDMAGKGKS